jgi:hypothetical protein
VLVTTTLLKLASAWRAAALSIPDVGVAVFFIAGVATSGAGVLAPWFVAAAVLLGLACRTVDVEGWGIRVKGGLPGRAGVAFGPKAAAVAASAQLLERVLFAALVSLVFGHYIAALPMWLFVPTVRWPRTESGRSRQAAVLLLGFAWARARLGYTTDVNRAVVHHWTAVGIVFAVVHWALMAVSAAAASAVALAPIRAFEQLRHAPATPVGVLLAILFAFRRALPAIGSGDSLARRCGARTTTDSRCLAHADHSHRLRRLRDNRVERSTWPSCRSMANRSVGRADSRHRPESPDGRGRGGHHSGDRRQCDPAARTGGPRRHLRCGAHAAQLGQQDARPGR